MLSDRSLPPGASRTVRGACPHDCPDTCALLTTVENGIAVKVQGNPAHPHTGGVLCAKVSRYTERSDHPERLLHPLRRVGPKGAGRFERVSWSAALDDIAARLQAMAARDPQAVLPYSYAGTMGLVQGESIAARFFHSLGASLRDIASGQVVRVFNQRGEYRCKAEVSARARPGVVNGRPAVA